jgi:alpha-beta hydrolase superfamily lysophospholipase
MVIALSVLSCTVLTWWLWTPDKDRSLLETRYLVAPTDMLQLGQRRLHVRVTGPNDAPAVILIHGFGASLQTWDAWAAGLSRTYRVIRFDLPGSGLKPQNVRDTRMP